MKYIRFLKPPRIEKQTLTTVITITTDLGESFHPDDVDLNATVRSSDYDGDIQLRKRLKWTNGMRSLPVHFDLANTDLDWPAVVHVAQKGKTESDHFEKHRGAFEYNVIVSAWSDTIDPTQGKTEAEKLVQRRFTSLGDRRLNIWEETGDSIARHIWDAGVALTAYIDRITALQVEGIPILDRVLTMATYRRMNVLELGSGCGIVGIDLAQTIPDCSVVLTDLEEAEDIIQKNISAATTAMASEISFQKLDWEEQLPGAITMKSFDIILLADCTYNADSSPALVRTIRALVNRSPKAVVAVAMKIRHQDELIFFDLMKKKDLIIGGSVNLPLPGDAVDGEKEKAELHVFQDKSRPALLARGGNAGEHSGSVSFWKD